VLFPFLIIAEPKDIFERVAARAPWFAPLAYCMVGFFIITWLGGCWTNIRAGLQWWSLLGPAAASVFFVGAASIGSTAILYAACGAMREPELERPTYRKLFSLNNHCALVLILGELVNFLLVRAGPMQDYNLPFPNRFPLGLDLLILGVKEPNIYLAILLHSTSVFVLWYLVVLARGLKYLTGSVSARTTAIVITLWLTGMGIIVGIIHSAGGGTIFRVTM
jgi:hypothetical protein